MQLLKINYVFLKKKLLQNMLQINILGMHKEKENKQKSLKKKYRRIVNMKISTNANWEINSFSSKG